MAFDLLLDDSGDIGTPPRPATGLALIKQRILRRLRTIEGEWFLDPTVGLPYLDWIATKPSPVAQIAAAMREAVETVPGVIYVEEWAAVHDPETRTVSVTGVVITATDDALTLRIEGVDATTPINAAPWAILISELF